MLLCLLTIFGCGSFHAGTVYCDRSVHTSIAMYGGQSHNMLVTRSSQTDIHALARYSFYSTACLDRFIYHASFVLVYPTAHIIHASIPAVRGCVTGPLVDRTKSTLRALPSLRLHPGERRSSDSTRPP